MPLPFGKMKGKIQIKEAQFKKIKFQETRLNLVQVWEKGHSTFDEGNQCFHNQNNYRSHILKVKKKFF